MSVPLASRLVKGDRAKPVAIAIWPDPFKNCRLGKLFCLLTGQPYNIQWLKRRPNQRVSGDKRREGEDRKSYQRNNGGRIQFGLDDRHEAIVGSLGACC